jgi:hypothetical protein
MVRRIRAIAWTLAAALVAVPASAAVYTIHLKSGDRFETRYQPRDASWDAGKVVFLDEVGNLISVAKGDIDRIDSDVESAGYGHMLDDTTMMLGRAPNDAPEAGSPEAEAAARADAAAAAVEGAAAGGEEPIYEPNASPPTMQVIPPASPGGTIYVEPAPPASAPAEVPAESPPPAL